MTENLSSSTHPPLPPTTEDDRFDRLRLLRSRRVGVVTYMSTGDIALGAAILEKARANGLVQPLLYRED